MLLVDDALATEVVALAHTALVPHPLDGFHSTLVALDLVGYNIIFLLWLLLLNLVSQLHYLRLLGFLLNFWLLFLYFGYFRFNLSFFRFQFRDGFDDV